MGEEILYFNLQPYSKNLTAWEYKVSFTILGGHQDTIEFSYIKLNPQFQEFPLVLLPLKQRASFYKLMKNSIPTSRHKFFSRILHYLGRNREKEVFAQLQSVTKNWQLLHSWNDLSLVTPKIIGKDDIQLQLSFLIWRIKMKSFFLP